MYTTAYTQLGGDMGTKKTLYVSDEDEAIWADAQKSGAGDENSLSKVVTMALAEYLKQIRAACE